MRQSIEIFWIFLRLGLVAFGGPVAHLGFYRQEFVDKRRWLTDASYAELIALAQMLPGPASSQTGFAIGLHRGGVMGGIAAWLGFTLPSAIIMIALGIGVLWLGDFSTAGWLQGLKLAAAAVVTHALYGMARQLCPDAKHALIAVAAALGATWLGGLGGQIGIIVLGAIMALLLLPTPSAGLQAGLSVHISRRTGLIALAVFMLGLLVFNLSVTGLSPLWGVLYRSGALVFGGGHVVLPLLESGLVAPGLLDSDRFLAGYGAAQAIPGPIFSFAGYLGTQVVAGNALMTGLIATVMIFAPGLLLVVAVLPFWQTLSRYLMVRKALLGINAAVVGLLAAVLWDPILIAGVTGLIDALILAIAVAALFTGRIAPYWVVAGCALIGQLAAMLMS